MTVKEKIRITLRGYRMIFKLDKKFAIYTCLSAVVSSLIPYVPIYFSALLIDELSGNRSISSLIVYASLTVGLSFLLYMANEIISKAKELQRRVFDNSENKCFADKIMDMDYEDMEKTETTLLREKIKVESQTGYNMWELIRTMENLICDGVKIAASAALVFTLFSNPGISLLSKAILLALTAAVIGVSYILTDMQQKAENTMMRDIINTNAVGNFYSEYFNNYNTGKDIRMYGMEDITYNAYTSVNKRSMEVMGKCYRFCAFASIISTSMSYILQLGLYVFIIYAALNGSVSIGSIAKYVSCVMLFINAVKNFIRMVQAAGANCSRLENYFKFLDIPRRMYKGSLTTEKRADRQYDVEFRNVSFRYPGADTYALRNVSMKFRIGEKLAVVGQNGSGKTTFIKLLCRMYDPTEGEILLNGIDIRKYDYKDYMSIFSVVFQDFKLFSFSLGQNVAARVDYDKDKVISCCRQSGITIADDNMADMDGNKREHLGIESCLYKDFDEKGIEVSGGEAQKIAFSRALYKDAPFIVLDEPTAALDPISEYEIYSRFNSIVGDKTTIYISHRLSSCRFCDNILVFDNGRIVQQGSHEELVAHKGSKYFELWNAQAQYYDVAATNI